MIHRVGIGSPDPNFYYNMVAAFLSSIFYKNFFIIFFLKVLTKSHSHVIIKPSKEERKLKQMKKPYIVFAKSDLFEAEMHCTNLAEAKRQYKKFKNDGSSYQGNIYLAETGEVLKHFYHEVDNDGITTTEYTSKELLR